MFGLGRAADWNSRLCRWDSSAANEKVAQTFSNQALNTLDTFAGKGLVALQNSWYVAIRNAGVAPQGIATSSDARMIETQADVWVTDPLYADAINYHELSEYFLAWYAKKLLNLFPDWNADSKRALAVRGTGADFRSSMVECYRNLAAHMPDDGLQVVMFTHQDASIWADLTLILWAAGLRVTAAWTIATETESALKAGNHVQGTVLMVLRKQISDETAFQDEVGPEVETEVERQLDSMLRLDDGEAPNFSDADYQLAAYAAALRVLTQYRAIEDIDIAYQLSRERHAGEANPIERIIEDAVKTASHALVPKGMPAYLWRRLGPEEEALSKGTRCREPRRVPCRRISGVRARLRCARLFRPNPLRQGERDTAQDRLRTRTSGVGRLRIRKEPCAPHPVRRLARGGDRGHIRQPHVVAYRAI